MAAIADSTSARAYLTTTVRSVPPPSSRRARTVAAIWPVPTGSVVTERTLAAVPAVPSTASNHCGVSCSVSSTTAGSGRVPAGAVVDAVRRRSSVPLGVRARCARLSVACTGGPWVPPSPERVLVCWTDD